MEKVFVAAFLTIFFEPLRLFFRGGGGGGAERVEDFLLFQSSSLARGIGVRETS